MYLAFVWRCLFICSTMSATIGSVDARSSRFVPFRLFASYFHGKIYGKIEINFNETELGVRVSSTKEWTVLTSFRFRRQCILGERNSLSPCEWIHLCFHVFWCVYFFIFPFFSFRRFGCCFGAAPFLSWFSIISQNKLNIKTMCKKCENNGTTTTFERKTIKHSAWENWHRKWVWLTQVRKIESVQTNEREGGRQIVRCHLMQSYYQCEFLLKKLSTHARAFSLSLYPYFLLLRFLKCCWNIW